MRAIANWVGVIFHMLNINSRIQDIDKTICDNIDLIDFPTVSRALVSQNLLGQSRNLCEHIAVKAYSNGSDIEVNWTTIPAALEFIKHDNKYLFLRKFHDFLQESKSHYTPDHEGAERLVLKYYRYYLMLRNFVKKEYQIDILHNLDKFPINTDRTVQRFHEKIAERIKIPRPITDYGRNERMYVHKVVPFVVDENVYYEMVLTPAYDTTSKFDRFIVYSKFMVPSHYAIKGSIFYDDIEIDGKRMPVNILVEYSVSIRPCELNNYAKFFGKKIKMSTTSAEYTGMMGYLSSSGSSLLDIAIAPQHEYDRIKQIMFGRSKVHHFEEILEKSREVILSETAGTNVIKYLLHTLNNKVLRDQYCSDENPLLSNLHLEWGCIPFDTMPFASSLIQHNPDSAELFGSISAERREHELLARYIHSNMSSNARLYTPIKELEEHVTNVDSLVAQFNSNIYKKKHAGRLIEKFGSNLYVRGALEDTKLIISKLQEAASSGVLGYEDAINAWISDKAHVDSDEKKQVLQEMFSKSRVALVYGAAGTGKTYLLNHISQFFDSKTKLFLANTHPAVENLRRKIKSQNCEFLTIRKFVSKKRIQTDCDILIIDECSMVSNEDMAAVLKKAKYKLLILVGDTYQIEAIAFGNWFSMAKYFIPSYAWNELETLYRTEDTGLLTLWEKVRNLEDNLTEHIVNNRYASNLDPTVFDKTAKDEIILCLNYDGLYGINNINRFLQENNPNHAYRWGLWTYKVGDPVLFNESERFTPILYNNLKGTILDINIDDDQEHIWFTIEVDKILTELDVMHTELELLNSVTAGKSVIKFRTTKKKSSDDDNDFVDDTVVPFQIAYAVSIHKAQGLEYDSVKVIITEEVDNMITHSIFYTAITRSKKYLKIYWSPETQEKIINGFEVLDAKNDATIFSAQTKMKMRKIRE